MSDVSIIRYSSDGNFSFEFEGQTINGQIDENGRLVFIASEVCSALGLNNVSRALDGLDEDEKGYVTNSNETPGRHTIRVVTESGLYHLIFKSKKAAAIRFRRQVTDEILPSIRMDSVYISSTATPKQLEAAQSKLEEMQRENLKLKRGLDDAQQVNQWLGGRQGAGKFLTNSLPDGDRD